MQAARLTPVDGGIKDTPKEAFDFLVMELERWGFRFRRPKLFQNAKGQLYCHTLAVWDRDGHRYELYATVEQVPKGWIAKGKPEPHGQRF